MSQDLSNSSIPRSMRHKEWCMICSKEMYIHSAALREDGSGVEVFYKCGCGYQLTFLYYGGFIEMFKKAVGIDKLEDDVPSTIYVSPGVVEQE